MAIERRRILARGPALRIARAEGVRHSVTLFDPSRRGCPLCYPAAKRLDDLFAGRVEIKRTPDPI